MNVSKTTAPQPPAAATAATALSTAETGAAGPGLSQATHRALLIAALVLTGIVGYCSFRVVPEFAAVFQSFGADLPWPTQLALRHHPALLALPLPVLLAWWFWPRRGQRGVAALVTAVALCVLVPGLLTLAMYLPIWALAR